MVRKMPCEFIAYAVFVVRRDDGSVVNTRVNNALRPFWIELPELEDGAALPLERIRESAMQNWGSAWERIVLASDTHSERVVLGYDNVDFDDRYPVLSEQREIAIKTTKGVVNVGVSIHVDMPASIQKFKRTVLTKALQNSLLKLIFVESRLDIEAITRVTTQTNDSRLN